MLRRMRWVSSGHDGLGMVAKVGGRMVRRLVHGLLARLGQACGRTGRCKADMRQAAPFMGIILCRSGVKLVRKRELRLRLTVTRAPPFGELLALSAPGGSIYGCDLENALAPAPSPQLPSSATRGGGGVGGGGEGQ